MKLFSASNLETLDKGCHCCDNCALVCQCNNPLEPMQFLKELEEVPNGNLVRRRQVSDSQRDSLNQKLLKYRKTLLPSNVKGAIHLNSAKRIYSKRGFTQNFGVVFVISVDSGQVLDYDFASKICVQCSKKKASFSKESEEFQLWYVTHQPDCTENHSGSSGAMEQDIARRIWNKSLAYNLHYNFMVCDGDSKAYNNVWDVYGACEDCNKWENIDKKTNEYKKWVESLAHEKWKSDHELGKADCARVMKLDCIGHVQKRMEKALRELRKKTTDKLNDGLSVGGKKHRLTDLCMDKLQYACPFVAIFNKRNSFNLIIYIFNLKYIYSI